MSPPAGTAGMGTARQLAKAILLSRPDLGAPFESLLTPEIAWTLSLLLWSWRPAGAPPIDVSNYSDVTGQFDRYADTLLRLRDAAGTAKTEFDLAGASGLFISAVKQIGTTLLAYVLRSPRFAKIQKEVLSLVAVPAVVVATGAPAGEQPQSRSKRYLGFDYRSARADSEPATSTIAPSDTEIAQWQGQLKRADLAPEMRWLLEQKLLAAKQNGYASVAEARQRWQDAMAKAGSDDLRAYFARNLKEVGTA